MVIHAFFKSMLFLRTGSLIRQVSGLQDSRFFGRRSLNFNSFLFFCVSCLCLSGFPFFLGFYSKDFIINSSSFSSGSLVYLIFLVGCIFTVIYRVRLIWRAYFKSFKYLTYFSLRDEKFFFVPVAFLFLKC